jgi:hypothetical protein
VAPGTPCSDGGIRDKTAQKGRRTRNLERRGGAPNWPQRAPVCALCEWGTREPDLATLVRIARSLETTPNELLGFGAELKRSKRTILRERLQLAAKAMDDRALELTVIQAEAVASS